MQNYISIRKLLFLGLVAILSACGGGGGGGGADSGGALTSGGSSLTVLAGQVADGYLSGARVYLDRNENRVLDSDEPSTYSTSGGHFSLEVASGEGSLYPLVVDVLAGQTIDEDNSGSFVGEGYQLEAPAGHWAFISPLTTLAKQEMDRNPDLALDAAVNSVRSQLGLSGGVSFFSDYVAGEANPELAAAHRAARLVAALMGSLQAQVAQNVDASEFDTQRNAVALMIGDQVVNHFAEIAQGINSATDTAAVATIKNTILAQIDTAGLDTQLLTRYVDRLQYSDPVWDMTPPEVQSQQPPSAGSASTDVVVSLRFDEALDPLSIDAGSVQLIGPAGPVSGTVSYNASLQQLEFKPDKYLLAYANYQVQVSGVEDSYGNPLHQTYSWDFSTIFDQLPPALPEF